MKASKFILNAQRLNMKASKLISILQHMMQEDGSDPDVGIQAFGCCNHAHSIEVVERGSPNYKGSDTSDEVGIIVIRGG